MPFKMTRELIVFLASILISQVILPFANKNFYYPFFVWNPYAESSVKWTFYDAEIQDKNGKIHFLSSIKERAVETWDLTNTCGTSIKLNESIDECKKFLVDHLSLAGYSLVNIVRIDTDLPSYLSLNHQQKKEKTHVVYNH